MRYLQGSSLRQAEAVLLAFFEALTRWERFSPIGSSAWTLLLAGPMILRHSVLNCELLTQGVCLIAQYARSKASVNGVAIVSMAASSNMSL